MRKENVQYRIKYKYQGLVCSDLLCLDEISIQGLKLARIINLKPICGTLQGKTEIRGKKALKMILRFKKVKDG